MRHRKIEIHGHRGSRGTLPENTLPSFEEAVSAGADYFELDIQLSADDVPIVFHDPAISPKLCREAKFKLPIRSLKAEEITQFDCGSVAQKDFPRQKQIPGTLIPTLEETLAWLAKASPTAGVNIEMKIEDPSVDPVAFTKVTLALVKKYGLVSRTLFQSFDFRPLTEASKLIPALRLSCLFEDAADFAAEAARIGAGCVGPSYQLLTEKHIAACHARGIKVIPWTVNELKDWERLIGLGVDGIITDYPRDLAAFLA